jgi:dipeptidyl aminopeptidase/acylaminoacyl peptidase
MRSRFVGSVLGIVVACGACGGGVAEAPPAKHESVLAAIASAAPKVPVAAPVKKEPPRADATLLPRSVLFSNPDRAATQVSPDGKRLSYLSSVDGVLNVWVAPIGDLAKARAVTADKKRGIRVYKWAFDNAHVLYLQDKDGDENWHLHSVDLKSNKDVDLTPMDGVQARVEHLSPKIPGEVLVGLNDRDKRYHDVWRIDVTTGKKKLVQQNDGFAAFVPDDDFKIRFGMKTDKDGSIDWRESDKAGGFKPYSRIPHEDAMNTVVLGFDKGVKKAYLTDSRGRDKAALVELDIATKQTKVLLDDGQADVRDIMQSPTDKHLQIAFANYERERMHVIDQTLRPEIEALQALAPGDVDILSRSLDDSKWVVASTVSDGPVKYYLWDRKKKKAEYLFSNIKALEGAKLAKMSPVTIRSRDGLDLVSYLTLPPAATPGKPLPMVLFVHGGPWGRDEWGLNRWHQWLANRGYAVLSVNYRGSTGFGKAFVNAADHEWAGKMHDDLIDAVSWAIAQKIADKDKVAIMGGSYGGYATLVGLTFTPDEFACGVDIVGPSNLETLLKSIPPYWESELDSFLKRIGDYRTEEGRKLLASRSPLNFADRIKRPLLIGQGANDPRVKQAESDQIVEKMNAKSIPVTYVLYPDEGHGFARPENRTSFNAVAEIFLAQCLGGPYQPIGGDFKGSTITVPAGKDQISTLADAIK